MTLGSGMMRYVYIDAAAQMSVRWSKGEVPLRDLQALVGGNIEGIYWSHERLMVYDNEDGLRLNLAPTVRFPKVYSLGDVLRGPVIIVGVAQGEQRDLTDFELLGIWLEHRDGDPYPTLHVDSPPEKGSNG